MKKRFFPLLILLFAVMPSLQQIQAAVLVVYTTEQLIDGATSDPLDGTNISGDLLQLLFPGVNGVIDAPNEFGAPGGDDTVFSVNAGPTSTHVGSNEPMVNWDMGLFNETYDIDALFVGEPIFLRFWNQSTPATSTHYGDTTIFTVPPEPGIGPIFLDFAPLPASARTAGTAFSASAPAAVPEPSTLPFFAMFLGILVYQVRRWAASAPVALAVLGGSLCFFFAGPETSQAQLAPRLDITASQPILDLDTQAPLKGNNPQAELFGFTNITGAVIQIIDAGANTVADLPDINGQVGGDDTVWATVTIGEGISPSQGLSGLLATSIDNPPAIGSRLYARAFNAETIETATHWGQSSIFVVRPLEIMDLSLLGLRATTIPLGIDITDSDTDGDGFTDLEELLANTSALDAAEVLAIDNIVQDAEGKNHFTFVAQPGRIYFVECSTTPLGETPVWNIVAVTAVIEQSETIELTEDAPPPGGQAMYRLLVAQP